MLTTCSLSVLSTQNPGSCDEAVVVQQALCSSINSILLYEVLIFFSQLSLRVYDVTLMDQKKLEMTLN